MIFRKAASIVLMAACAVTMQAQRRNTPMMGWSSWNTFRVNISDSLIMQQADALVATGLREAGYTYINIDDGFFGKRDATGRMTTHEKRFPRGMKCVTDHIHGLGLKAGIYSDGGINSCGSRYDNDENGLGAGLYGHDEQDAHLYFGEWKFDFIKIDYCGGRWMKLNPRTRYTEIRRTFDAAGYPYVDINICNNSFPGTWGSDVACSWRISTDIRPRWSHIRNIIARNLYLSAYCSPGHYNDMDMLEMGRGLPRNEEEVHFGMWCIMSSPLLIGCNLTRLPEHTLVLLSNPELIALNQDTLGLQARVVARCGEGYVLAKDIRTRRGTTRAVALYNPSDSVCSFNVPTVRLELGGRVALRNLIERKDMGEVREEISLEVQPHGVIILQAEGERRLEPTVYEAEWAYLPCHEGEGGDGTGSVSVPHDRASGGMLVTHIGGSAESVARWNDVWSERGGKYTITLSYVADAGRGLEVSINGKPVTVNLPAEAEGMSQITMRVKLQKGWNTIEMGCTGKPAVDIDKIELKRR